MIDNARWWGRQRPLLIGRSRRRRRPRSYGMAGSNIELAGVRRAIQRDRVSPCRPLAPAQSLWLWIIEWVDVLSCLSVWIGPMRGVAAYGPSRWFTVQYCRSCVLHLQTAGFSVVMSRSAKEIEPLEAFLSLNLFEREREIFFE
jgi:hypothetical protein